MVEEFINFYSKNINNESKPLDGLLDFLKWANNNNISLAVCTNKQEKLAVDLLKKLSIFNYFEFVAGSDTFDFNKPDPRHLTNVIDIVKGDINKTLMVGDSEVDELSAHNAKIPFVLVENGYTEKKASEIKHDYLIKDFKNFDKIVKKFL